MNRRDFLKVTVAATAAATVSSCSQLNSNVPKPYIIDGRNRMRLRFFPYELQLEHTFTVSSYSRKTTPDVQVEIEYDGFTGYGEASMPPYLGHTTESVCSFLKKVDLGQFSDPFKMEDILDYVDSISDGDAPAKAAIDIALHDLTGKLIGQPIYRIWGSNPDNAGPTCFTIGIDTADVVRKKTIECAGKFKVLKVKVGLDNDVEMIETIRSVSDLPLVVDANQGWTDREKAIDEILWLAERGVKMVEQPMAVDRIDDIARITEVSPIPIIADEACQRLKDIKGLKGAYSGINIKLMKCTGLMEARKMVNYARAENMAVMVGCMTETSCACTAAANLAPYADFCDIDGNLLITNDRFEGMVVKEGLMVLPERPGLGLLLKK